MTVSASDRIPDLLSTRRLVTGYRLGGRRKKVVSEGLDLSLARGQVVSLIGPNGAGKSTLLRTLCGVQPPLSGTIFGKGTDLRQISIRDRARLLSVVLTGRPDVGYLSGFALTSLGRFPHTGRLGSLGPRDREAVFSAMRAVGADHLADRAVSSLSDGEFQKLMIARALAQETEVMVLDEPAAFLDLPRRVEMMELLRSIARESGRGVLVSSHDLELALRESDRIWLMNSQAQVIEGAPEDLVLQGELEACFDNEIVKFDHVHGLFVIPSRRTREVSIAGGGIPGVWTRRALSRGGYEAHLDRHSGRPHVEIGNLQGKTHWTISHIGMSRTASSLEEMLLALQAMLHDSREQ